MMNLNYDILYTNNIMMQNNVCSLRNSSFPTSDSWLTPFLNNHDFGKNYFY